MVDHNGDEMRPCSEQPDQANTFDVETEEGTKYRVTYQIEEM